MTEENTMPSTANVEDIASSLETLLAEQKAFKKRPDVKAVFDENRAFNKQVKELKENLRAAMQAKGVTTAVVGGIEIELKPSTREKHDPNLLEDAMGNEKFSNYMSMVSIQDDKVVTRRANKRPKSSDSE